MKYLSLVIVLLATVMAGAQAPESAPTPAATTPTTATPATAMPEHVENFRLIDHTGTSWELHRLKDAPAVVLYIYGVGCPIVQKGTPGLERLKKDYEQKGVKFLLLDANEADTREDVAKEAKEFGVTSPVLLDPAQQIAKALGVTRTAEAIVIVPRDDWKIAYRGAVDDRFDYGAQKNEATKEWLKDALEAVLAGKPVAEPRTNVKGCIVSYAETASLTYEHDIAPIIKAKCADCHVDKGIGPFPFAEFADVRGRKGMMREVIRTRLMPPWHADREYGKFENDRSLTVDEERKLLAWLDQGAPRDEASPDPLAGAAHAPEEFSLGKPDLLLQLPEPQELPAEGVVDYRYVTVPTNLTEDRWVRAVDVEPTNRAVVHHALIFVIYPKEYRHIQPDASGGLNGYFAAYLPGALIKPFPAGSGQFLPKGSAFIFQMHYTPTGKPETDQTRMALYFHDEKPEKAYQVIAGADTDFKIPPNEADSHVKAAQRFENPVEIYGLSPHMHYRGGRARFEAVTPDQGVETLLNIPFYQFDWQPMYNFEKPLALPAGSKIVVDGGFDNSAFNPRNPNPNTWVFFGVQSFEEMFIGYVAYGEPRDDAKYSPRPVEGTPGAPITAENIVGTKWRLDRDIVIEFQKDGIVMANGMLKANWVMSHNDIYITSNLRDVWLSVVGDELLFQGEPVDRVD